MPLPKRLVEPVHVSRGTVPENFPLPSELEASTNGTLANTVRQLSSLSRHAEDLFGELARDAQQLYQRSNSLQERIDRLAIKVTQLDSTVEEVSLQDIHMRKAFKSSLVFDQQIFSRDTMPTAMLETYKTCDRPPPLDKLNPYRDDGKDGLKYYTDPNYFFELWREEMVKDTERAMQTKKPHRPRNAQTTSGDGGGGRHKKRVRQPHNTRERFRQIAVCHGEYIMPQQLRANSGNAQQQQQYITTNTVQNGNAAADEYQHQLMQQHAQRPNSIEIHRPYSNQQAEEMIDGIGMNHNQHSPMLMMDEADYNPYQYNNANASSGSLNNDTMYNQQQQQQQGAGTPTRRVRPTQPPPAPPSNPTSPLSQLSTPTRRTAASAGIAAAAAALAAAAARDNLPPPPPPPEGGQGTTCGGTTSPPIAGSGMLSRQASTPEPSMDQLPPPPPVPIAPMPPPPPPMPPTIPPATAHQDGTGMSSASPPLVLSGGIVIKAASPPRSDRPPAHVDPRNDLLKAIRDGIKLRKVEKIEQKEVERGNGLHDVASILARRVAVEFSESDSGSAESDCESEGGWGENETSA